MKSRLSFYVVFGIIVLVASIATYRNLSEYRKQNQIQEKGIRTLGVVQDCNKSGSRYAIAVYFMHNQQRFQAEKKVKQPLAVGDSVPVYFLHDQPEVNGIAVE